MTNYHIPETVLLQDVGEETVAMETERGQYYEFNAVGAEMLRLLKQFGNSEAVLEHMLGRYNIARAALEQDLAQFIDELEQHHLLKKKS